MISVLICSVRPDLLDRVKQSVASTIGVDYECLASDNRNTGKGICQVYNELAERARFPILLFLHEDVTFENTNWGLRFIEQFEHDNQLGLVGLAGSNTKSRSASGWYTADPAHDRYHILHQMPGAFEQLHQVPDEMKSFFRVVCLDGVFLCCRRSVWESIRFNERDLRGFHFYDLDFSLRVSKQFHVAVTTLVELTHHTDAGGDYSSNWVREALAFHSRWGDQLPLSIDQQHISEYSIQRIWMDRLKDQPISFTDRLRWIFAQRLWRTPANLYSIGKFLLYRPLRLRYLHRYLRSRKSAH
ncbi:MAG: glycosyltransferase [Bacteroidota bacterium]